MTVYLKIIIIGFILFSCSIGQAQTDSINLADLIEQVQQDSFLLDSLAIVERSNEPPNYIGVIGRAKGDSILLRWAPSDAVVWSKSIKLGYQLARVALDADGNVLIESRKVLADENNPIMPWDSIRFMNYGNPNDSLVGLAAQAMYGSSFKSSGNGEDADNIFGRATEFANRHGFGLYAADRSINAAKALGLSYTDRDIDANTSYIYYVHVKQDSTILSRGFTKVVPRGDHNGEASILGLRTESQDLAITLHWSKNQTELYSGYYIERSDDGGDSYIKLNETPLVFLEKDENISNEFAYQDSVVQNYKIYHYRIRALTPFADLSSYTITTAQGIDLTPPVNPYFGKYKVLADQSVELNWKIDTIEPDLSGFYIYKSNSTQGEYRKLFEEALPSTTFQFITDSLDETDTHYYTIAAIDTAGNESQSFPLFANVPDNNPPAPPANLIYAVDTLGKVTLGWEAGKEKDLVGYRVYFSNNLQNEFTQLTVSVIDHNYFLDTIQIKTLTETIYYKVQAVDKRYNRSELSEAIEVKKPDIVPPVTPVFRYPEISDSTIVLHWNRSSSEDLENHLIYRRVHDSQIVWQLLDTLSKTTITYTDINAVPEVVYEYSLRALDDDGLLSDFAFPVKGRVYFNAPIASVDNLTATFNQEKRTVQLKWAYNESQTELLKGLNYRFNIFRALEGESMKRVKQISPNTYTDTKLPEKGNCKYSIQVVFENGKKSVQSEEIDVLISELK